MTSLFDDIRYAFRLLARQPAFTAAAVLLLALGIGVNSAIFSLVDSVLLRPLPYRNPEALYNLWTRNLPRKIPQSAVSPPEFLEYAAHVKSFSFCAAFMNVTATMTGRGQPTRVSTTLVSRGYLEMLGMTPVLGRGFAAEEFQLGRNQVVILTENYWKTQFGADPTILGKNIRLDDELHVVVGVLPAIKGGSRSLDLYAPLVFNPATLAAWDSRFLYVIARLRDGVSVEQAGAELTAIAGRLAQEHPDSNTRLEAYLVQSVRDAQGESREPLILLSAAVGLVLLVTCSNLGNLLLIRSGARHREIAIRSAMGASQARVFVQMITENLMLALLGGAAGLIVAGWSLRAIAHFGPANMPRLQDATVDYSVVAFTFGVSLLAGLLFGVAPAWHALRLNLASTLRDESRGSSGGVRKSLFRSIFVVSEVAISVILLISAGLLLRTFAAISQIDTGFNSARVLTLRTTLPETRYPTPESRDAYVRKAIRQLESTPGVLSAGSTTALPMMQVNWRAHFTVEGQPGPRETSTYSAITPHYLSSIGAALVKGRGFAETDGAEADPVVLISQALERRYFANQDPLGQSLMMQVGALTYRARIVGVVRDIAQLRPEEAPRVTIYQPHAQCPWGFLAFAVRTAVEPASMTETMRRVFFEVDPNLPVERIQPLGDLLDRVLAQRRLSMVLLLIFSGLAVVLAAIGLYGVLAVAVAQRGREIGIRMALGAEGGDIVRLVLTQGLGLTVAGLLAGLATAPLASFAMKQMLYGVEPLDPLTFGASAVVILIAALAASLHPARRASQVDPATSLRAE
ncbi:MAG TPA: ABC transporter permease [Paludibaculum sp.]